MKNINAYIKLYLELLEPQKTLPDLAEALGLSYQGLYRKLKGDINIRPDEKKTINEFLKLNKKQREELWTE